MKIPQSVLVVVHTPQLDVLVLERRDHPGFWQSVTGSLDAPDEPHVEACRREVEEETGLACPREAFVDWGVTNRYAIYPQWRHRYAPGVTENVERVFGLCVARPRPVRLAPAEHVAWDWLGWEAAAERCFSWTNVEAIRLLARRGADPVSPEAAR